MTNRVWILGIVFVVFMWGCSVDHGVPDQGLDPDLPKVTISGVVASGAPVSGVVILKNSSALNVSLKDVIGQDGSFSIPLATEMTGPYLLQARGTVGGRVVYLHSMGMRSDESATVNITPFTDLIVGNVLGKVPEEYFETFDGPSLSDVATPMNIQRHEALLKSRLQKLLDSAEVDETGQFNLISTAFEADHSGMDAVLDFIRVIPTWEGDGQQSQTMLIRNFFTGEFIEDDLTVDSETDALPPFQVTDFLNASQAVVDINDVFDHWMSLFDDDSPSSLGEVDEVAALEDLFSGDFMVNGFDRDSFLEKIISDENLVGFSFSGLSVDSLDTANGSARVSFDVINNRYHTESHYGWYMIRSNGRWLIRGNQQILDVYAGSYAAFGRLINTVLFNGMSLYAHAPVDYRASTVDYITVSGPGIDPENPYRLSKQVGTPVVFVNLESQPQGFYQPIDSNGDAFPMGLTDNSEYVFTLYDNENNVLNPGGYIRILKRGNKSDQILLDHVDEHFVKLSKPIPLIFLNFTGDGYVDCIWNLPFRVKTISINHFGVNANGEFFLTEKLDTTDEDYKSWIDKSNIQRFDLYIRTLDEFDRVRDTFMSKNVADGRTTQAKTLIDLDRVF
ncbi:MAG: carboxypeptidase-like regulatory domain-containing protein [Proteobacteria bacterium]|nr:carboxypeptidase-like regulatory domain-containing protein [Pseudomonadota bacterium]